jgi:hypothetical protein
MAALLQPVESMDNPPDGQMPKNNILATRVDYRPLHGQ